MFVELTLDGGAKMLINVKHIKYITQRTNGCIIYQRNTENYVKETIEEIKTKMGIQVIR